MISSALQKSLDRQINTPFFIIGQRTEARDDFGFQLIEMEYIGMLDSAPDVGVTNNVINRGVEIISHALENIQFGFNVVILIFIDGRLADVDGFGQALLADAVFLAKKFQIG